MTTYIENNEEFGPYFKPWEYFPEHISNEWHMKEGNPQSIFVRLYDSKNQCVLDYVEHPMKDDFAYMRKIMKLFIESLIENGVI